MTGTLVTGQGGIFNWGGVMTDRELIYRHISDSSWTRSAGAEVSIPSGELDERVLAIKYVYWPKGRSDGSALDPGGVVFEVSSWIKEVRSEGICWKVRFSRAIVADGLISTLFSEAEIVLAEGVKRLFLRETPFDVEGFKAPSHKDTYLSIKAAKEGMSLFYGIDPEFISVKIEQ